MPIEAMRSSPQPVLGFKPKAIQSTTKLSRN